MFDAVVRGAFRTILRRVFAAQWRASRRLQVVLISAVGVSLFFALTAGAPLGGAAPTKTFSIGGTVSGLSGTVVLQDNGGDDLSVSSSGPFTFATKLPTGAAYNVTVKTNPSGQTCSITNGTGTVGTANVTSITLTCTTWTSASENFNRANGGLGASWAATSDGSLSIVSQQALGKAGAYAGNIRVAESYGSDQYSQIEVTSTQLSGNQWIGPTVRSQNGGQNTYLGIYVWNNGNAQLRLYKRTAGTLTQLGSSYKSGPLPAGTKLTLTAIGSTISFQQNGATRIAVTDNTLTGGAAGLMTFGAARADNWAGGTGTVPPPPSTYSIGGTVSGLSGTVVLQDNGGDDLTVSANGAFTFATKLATGTAYNVTVKTNPERPDLQRHQRHRHRRLGERHQHHRHLHHEHVLDRRHRVRTVGHGRVAGQRRRRSERQRQRRVHVRHQTRAPAPLQRHRQDQPERPDLQHLQRHRHRRLGERHQHRRHLHHEHLLDRRDRVRTVGHGRVAGQRRR